MSTAAAGARGARVVVHGAKAGSTMAEAPQLALPSPPDATLPPEIVASAIGSGAAMGHAAWQPHRSGLEREAVLALRLPLVRL